MTLNFLLTVFTTFAATSLMALPITEKVSQEAVCSSCKHESVALIEISRVAPTIVKDMRYSTVKNIFNKAIYSNPSCYLHRDVAVALGNVQKELEILGFSLKIFDAYRPAHVHKMMWDLIKDERFVSDPAKSQGGHPRGTAVDVTLVDKEGREVEMPTLYNDFLASNLNVNQLKPSKEADYHLALLKRALIKHGFVQAKDAWWHFEFSNGQDEALYPVLDYSFHQLEKIAPLSI
jgi:D-alanyl-D-alanine dipeptidase